jgi:hypothetical protein
MTDSDYTPTYVLCERRTRDIVEDPVWALYAPACKTLPDFVLLRKLVKLADIEKLNSAEKTKMQEIIERIE